jgi:hypothetical protein
VSLSVRSCWSSLTGGSPPASLDDLDDLDETTECGWFAIEELSRADLGPFAGSTFEAMGWIYI